MRKMNCRNVRREIEEVASGEMLSSSAHDHLKKCAQCATFREERLKLREMLSSLGAVEAPGDFDFRLRARLANEKSGLRQPFVMRNLTFGFRSASAATIVLLIGSAILFVSLRTPTNSPVAPIESKPAPTTTDKSADNGKKGSENPGTIATSVNNQQSDVAGFSPHRGPKVSSKRNGGFRRAQLASARREAGSNGRLNTRDQASTEARVLRPKDALAETEYVFPISASNQPLKVSLDDGTGVSRTISLPPVSFGSQRVLAQGSSPLLAAARTDW